MRQIIATYDGKTPLHLKYCDTRIVKYRFRQYILVKYCISTAKYSI